MKLNPKSFENVGRSTPYLAWAAEGLRPSEVKARAIAILQPHLENPSVLDDLPIDVLGFEAVSVYRFAQNPWSLEMYKGVLSEYRQAHLTDAQSSLEAFSEWQTQLLRAQSEFQSLYLLEVNKSELELDEFRVEILRDIGALLEACVQPHLKALVQQVRVRRSRRATLSSLENAKFGVIVDELSHTLINPELVAPPPWNLKLHIFRNIAQHHSTALRNERIVCAYKTGQINQEIEFSREDLLLVARKIMEVLGILRSARTMFYLDHVNAMSDLPSADTKTSVAIFILSVAAATQGFEVIGFDATDHQAHLRVRDVTDGNARDRGIHASQFLVQVWIHSRSSNVRVTYFDMAGKSRLVADAKNTDCEDIAEGRTPFETLAGRVTFRIGS